MKNKNIQFNVKELPIRIQIKGESGEQKDYILTPAGKKFGACLQVPNAVPT